MIRPKRSYPEHALQVSIVDALRLLLPPVWRVVASTNGGRRTPWAATRSIRAGELPGFPDLQVIGPDKILFIEVKSKNGTVSPEQKLIHAWLEKCGFPVAVVRDLDHALSFLAANEVPIRRRGA